MLCVVNGITGISIDGVEYKAEDHLIEIPDEKYRKVVHHPSIRAATSKEIAALTKLAAAQKAEEEGKRRQEEAAKAEKIAAEQKAAEAQAKREAEEKAAETAAKQLEKEAETKGGGKNGK